MRGLFITFEGTEGSGKSTQIVVLTRRLTELGHKVRVLREPGGTPIGEEIRHTLKHSNINHGMTPETELLLMNASRAQLVGETIRPALKDGYIVLCDRFYDSTVAYQGYGRGLDLQLVRQTIDCAVGATRPDLTLLLIVPVAVSEARRLGGCFPAWNRCVTAWKRRTAPFLSGLRKRYEKLAAAEPARIRNIDATLPVDKVSQAVWAVIEPLLPKSSR